MSHSFELVYQGTDDMTARYTYLADATKLEVVDGDGCGYDYLGSLVYRKNDDDSYTLESTAFSGGRIVRNSSGSYRINGFVTDHLGSIRTVYDVETGDIIERNDYYPFGKRLNNSLAMSPTNRYRFSGKVARGSQRTFLCSRPEQQGFSPPVQQIVANVSLLDFGARMYDDEICRWTTVDPLAEKYYSMTPYNYCANNPVMFVDPEGKEWYKDNDGNIIYHEGALSEDEIKQHGYTYMGYYFSNDDTYYSLFGDKISKSETFNGLSVWEVYRTADCAIYTHLNPIIDYSDYSDSANRITVHISGAELGQQSFVRYGKHSGQNQFHTVDTKDDGILVQNSYYGCCEKESAIVRLFPTKESPSGGFNVETIRDYYLTLTNSTGYCVFQLRFNYSNAKNMVNCVNRLFNRTYIVTPPTTRENQ